MLSPHEKLDYLARMGMELNQINDLDLLLERVLSRARQFVNADAGSIFIKHSKQLRFSHTQNDTLERNLRHGKKLIYSTFSIPIDTHSLAGFAASTGSVLNIPDVYKLSPTLPYKFSQRFDESSGYKTQSVITIPLKNMRGGILGILQMINAQNEFGEIVPFSANNEKFLHHFAGIAAVALERAQLTRALIMRMIRMAEMRDPSETANHVTRVAGYAVEIYEQWAKGHGIDGNEIERNRDILRMAAMLHDVGKTATSDLILKKPARLNADEYGVMQQHTLQGARLFLSQQSDMDEAASIVALNHHERWDGNGYPGHVDIRTGRPLPRFKNRDGTARGKSGYEIPLFGRIVALADVYDALCSKRSYKDPWDEEKIIEYIEKASGSQFDPELVDIFLNRLDILRSIHDRYNYD